MNQCLFKLLFFTLFYGVLPVRISAEVLHPMIVTQNLTTFHEWPNLPSERQDIVTKKHIKWQNNKPKLHKLFFQKWKGTDGERGWLILAIVLLSIGAFLFTLYGLIGLLFVVLFWDGGGGAILFAFLALAVLALAVLCIAGIVRIAKKLRGWKQGEIPLPDLPHRPPSRKMEN